MHLAHKIRLEPNKEQRIYLAKAAGCARFAYNWALNEWNTRYEAGERPKENELRKHLNAIKREQFPWMLEVTKCAPQLAIKQLGMAFKNFFAGRAEHPTFHKKGCHDSFELSNEQFEMDGRRIWVPKLGWVRMRECLRFSGKLIKATISRTADCWFASITVEMPDKTTDHENQMVVGVDLGVSNLATLSNGEKIAGVKPYKHLEDRLKRMQRSLSRKQKGSSNHKKAKMKLAKLHMRIANIRADGLHKLTTRLTREYSRIGIEDLNVSGMLKNHRLAGSIADMSFYEFRRQLEYKAKLYGTCLVVADRWYASSKTCSECGFKIDTLLLSERKWECPACGSIHDRDINAAKNLENLAVSSTVTACGATQ